MLPQFRKPENEGPKSMSSVPMPASASSLPSPSTQQPLGMRPAAAFRSPASGNQPSVIGPDLLIQGNLISKGEVQVEGEVQGDIHGTHIVVGEKAKITGSIVSEECIVRGHVLGTVRSRRVLLQSACHVEGDIYHQTVAIEQGAFFEGKSRRSDDPIAGASRPADRRMEMAPAAAPAAAAPAAAAVEKTDPDATLIIPSSSSSSLFGG